MEKAKYFILGALVMLLFLFLLREMFPQRNVGRYQVMTVQQDVRWIWMVDTKTGVAKLLRSDGTQEGVDVRFYKQK